MVWGFRIWILGGWVLGLGAGVWILGLVGGVWNFRGRAEDLGFEGVCGGGERGGGGLELGFWIWGLGFGAGGLGVGILSFGFWVGVWGLGFRVLRLVGYDVGGAGFRAQRLPERDTEKVQIIEAYTTARNLGVRGCLTPLVMQAVQKQDQNLTVSIEREREREREREQESFTTYNEATMHVFLPSLCLT